MQTKVQKWGNSLGLRIPKSLAEQVGVGAGSEVEVTIEAGHLVVRARRLPRYDLTVLLEGVTADNVHEEFETGKPSGREIW